VSFADQIALLLGQATPKQMYRHATLGYLDPRASAGAIGPETYVEVDGEVTLTSEPAELLQRLYASASPDDRKVFAPTLVARLNGVNARVVARTLAATGHLDALIGLKATVEVEEPEQELWRGLIHAMRFEPSLFSEAAERDADANLR
jgi:hypothetical protein